MSKWSDKLFTEQIDCEHNCTARYDLIKMLKISLFRSERLFIWRALFFLPLESPQPPQRCWELTKDIYSYFEIVQENF